MSSVSPATNSPQSVRPGPRDSQQIVNPTFGTILRRAVLAGLVAGVLAAVFVGLVAEDSIDEAIAIEEASAAADSGAHSHGDDEALFSRSVQVVGGLAASVLYGLVMGVVFGTVYAAIRHRLGTVDESRRVLLLAGVAYVATALLPAIKYPANPPAVGDPDTVNERTLLYFSFMAACIVLAVAVGLAYKRLVARHSRSTALTLAGVASLVGIAVLLVVWPSSPDKVAADFPAQLLWDFRVESLMTLTIIWAALGLFMGWLSREPGVTSGSTTQGVAPA